MNNKELFERTTQVLVKAYFEGTLAKGSCTACAVGNICAAAMNERIISFDYFEAGQPEYADWIDVVHSLEVGPTSGYEVIKSSGYSFMDLRAIEAAFEGNTLIMWEDYRRHEKSEIDQDQFNGLMAVMDVLFEIHEVEKEHHQEYKKLFVKNSLS